MCAQTLRSYSRSTAPAKARCSSSSPGNGALPSQDALSTRGLVQKNAERRHIRVPLDERRPRTEEGHRLGVKRPHLGCDARAVIVDADRAAVFELAQPVSGEMELADGLCRQRAQVGGC